MDDATLGIQWLSWFSLMCSSVMHSWKDICTVLENVSKKSHFTTSKRCKLHLLKTRLKCFRDSEAISRLKITNKFEWDISNGFQTMWFPGGLPICEWWECKFLEHFSCCISRSIKNHFKSFDSEEVLCRNSHIYKLSSQGEVGSAHRRRSKS